MNKKEAMYTTIFVLVLVILLSFNATSVNITYLDSITMGNQARGCDWNENGTWFGIPNKNGQVGDDDFVVYSIDDYNNPIKSMPLDADDMVLDYCWKHPFVVACGGDETNVINYTNNWAVERQITSGTRTHSGCFAHDGYFFIQEKLVGGASADLNIWNSSSNNPADWTINRTILLEATTDNIGTIKVNHDSTVLAFHENEEPGYTDNKVHVYDISSSNPDDWSESYVLTDVGGFDISPNGYFIACSNYSGGTTLIYWLSNGTLFRDYDYDSDEIKTPVFHPNTVDTEEGFDYGFMLVGNSTGYIPTINLTSWVQTNNNTGHATGGFFFNKTGELLGGSSGSIADVLSIYEYGVPSYTPASDGIEILFIEGNVNVSTIYTATPTINWTVVEDTSQYHLEIDNNADFSSPEVNYTDINQYNYPTYCLINATRVSFTLPSGLPSYDTYYMKVRALTRN